MALPRLPAAQAYIPLMTMVVVVVVAIIVAVPGRRDDPDLWATFSLDTPPPGGPGAVSAHARRPNVEWRISATRHSSLGEHRHFDQLVDERVVLGAWAQEHALSDGRRTLAGREPRLLDARAARAAAYDEVAIARAVVGIGTLRAAPVAVPAYVPTADGLEPVALVTLAAETPLGDWLVVVSEVDGEVLRVDDMLGREVGAGDVFAGVPDVPCDAGPDTPDVELAAHVSRATLPHMTGTGYLDGRYVRTLNGGNPRARETDLVFAYPPSHDGFEQVMCYYTITRYFAHIESLGVAGLGGSAIVADAHGYPGDNSFYSPSTGQLSFGDGGVPDAQDAEIILHELGHALHHRAHPSYPFSYASRALSEGIADYLACSFFDDPNVAEWDAAAYSDECPPYLRRLDRLLLYPEDVTGSVHADGQIWSTALWSVRAALGARVTDRVLLESMFLLPPQAGPREAAAAFLTADDILHDGRHRPDAEAVFRERGLVTDGASTTTPPPIFARAVPNPFRTKSTIRYVLVESGRVRVDITDVRGRLVRTLVHGHEGGGSHSIAWDGTDGTGRDVPAGVYFYHVMSGPSIATGKLVRLR